MIQLPGLRPGGDLFSLAGALAELLGAPVTIEDRDTAVLAYSDGQSSVDAARTETILGRRVPPEYRETLQRAGVYRRILAERGVVYADLAEAGMKPRAIVGIRAGDEFLGSVWAALSGPPSPEQERALLDAVPVIADYLLQDREQRDSASRARFDGVVALLRGGAEAETAAAGLGLVGGTMVVVAAAPGSSPWPSTEAERGAEEGAGTVGHIVRADRVADVLSLYLSALKTRAAVAVVDGSVYAVLRSEAAAARRIMLDFLDRHPDRGQLVVGIGRAVPGPAELHRSRSDAADVVRVLAGRGRVGEAASIEDAFVDVVIRRVADTLNSDDLGSYGPLTALARSDAEHGSHLVATAHAYLSHGGDVRAAAAVLHVHPNTLRNRVRKIMDTCGVDLDDADTRLAVMLQLRAAPFAGSPRRPARYSAG